MSLLNLPSDGLPNVLVVLYSTVALARSPLTADEVLDRVAPAGVITEPRMARVTLNRWIELGLFRGMMPTSASCSLGRLRRI